ncbi:unnamed protein product [Leptosia nina]|uniref:Salivary secreted peptide n=1 Tax=Leptosia nina TaxID=320188 RepID=A0AAV1J257_9NEOP
MLYIGFVNALDYYKTNHFQVSGIKERKEEKKMKSLVVLVTLIVVAISSGAVVYPTNRSSFSVGYITTGDRLLHRQYLRKLPVPNAIQYQDFVFRGNSTTRVAAITATEMGYSQNAYAVITAGGVGYNYVTVRVQSSRSLGYDYVIEVWGRGR